MNEDFLHYVWKFRLFEQLNLKTTSGELLEITSVGEHNTHAGPDFFNARIKTGITLWAGNVEIHVKASDWKKHLHQNDEAYNNVILHVVLEADEEIKNSKGQTIPTLELKYLIYPHVQSNYKKLGSSKSSVPCGKLLSDVPSVILYTWLERLVIERLEEKIATIKNTLVQNKNNWEEAFYIHLAQNFGFKVNAQAFYLLAKSLPMNILAKHKNNLVQLEALIFGQAGMLEEQFADKYPQQLQNEYTFLKHKYSLQPINKVNWKFLRLRPVNFPTIRLAEFALLINTSTSLFSKILGQKTTKSLKSLFNAGVSDYWKDHFHFDKAAEKKEKRIGEDAISNILINTVIPFLFLYGKEKNDESFTKRALNLLEELDAEENSIVKKYTQYAVRIENAAQSQALIQLHNNYCATKKCLSCSIGNHLLSKKQVV